MSDLSFSKKNSRKKQTENLTDNLTDKVSAGIEKIEEKHGDKIEKISFFSRKYRESTISVFSGQTSFFLILSAFPFLLFFFSLLDLTPLSEADFLFAASQIVPESLMETLATLTHDIYIGSSGGLISATIISALWLSSKSFVSLQQGLNAIYDVDETRNYILMRLYGVVCSVVMAVLLLALLAVMVFGKKIRDYIFPETTFLDTIIDMRLFICIPVLFLFFMLLYVFLPNRRQRVKQQVPGAAFSAGGWIVFSALFSIYVDRYSNYSSFYGTMTTIALTMVWLYGCMYVFFLGGFINRTLEMKKAIDN